MSALLASLLMMFATAGTPRDAPAEVVGTDALGPVSLETFECVSVARSAVVGRVCHDAARRIAVAEVGGRMRAYCGMSRETRDAWLAAPSMGRFHAERVEGSHRCEPSPPTGAPA
jgi:hypothetical protein